MALTHKMESALNDQITSELGASLTYLQLAALLDAEDRPGMARWMQEQAVEETGHAQQFIDHVVDRGGHVAIGSIPAPPSGLKGPVAIFEAALGHERKVTGEIKALYQLATASGDVDSLPLLHRFLDEQVEEEATVGGILERIRRIEDSEAALLIIEQELAGRRGE